VRRVTGLEDVESFRRRARDWISGNLREVSPEEAEWLSDVQDDGAVARNRELMAALFAVGLSGICFPREFGGQGLGRQHLQAFTEEAAGHELPFMFHLPTLTILAPTLLDFGTEEQKHAHIPAMLRGEELWVQFLSEPGSGSDLASARTRATTDGHDYVLDGSKIWSSAANRADYAMCLCRTDGDVPKHAGLSVLIVKVHQPGVVVQQIRQVNGAREFCQEFFDNVRVPTSNLIGAVGQGWAVTTRLLEHEKLAVGGGSMFGLLADRGGRSARDDSDLLLRVVQENGRGDDPVARQMIGESAALARTQRALIDHIGQSIAAGRLSPSAASLLKLFSATAAIRRSELGAALGGPAMVAGSSAGHEMAVHFLVRQAAGLAGGSNEIQRNIIAERVLGMPREWAADRGVPFNRIGSQDAPGRLPALEPLVTARRAAGYCSSSHWLNRGARFSLNAARESAASGW
jgi:alkylation response protein AidB-like acyl-CoA dehydrogenase